MWRKHTTTTRGGGRGGQVIIVCWRSAEGQSIAGQQICSPFLPSVLLSISPLPHLSVMSFGLMRPCWRTSCRRLSPIEWPGCCSCCFLREQDSAPINSPSALHLNSSGTNQRRGGDSSSSSVQNLAYVLRGAQKCCLSNKSAGELDLTSQNVKHKYCSLS